MKTSFKLLLLILLVGVNQVVIADPTVNNSYSEPGFYFGGQVFSDFHNPPSDAAVDNIFSGFVNGGGFLGYQFNQFISVQIGYNSLSSDSSDGYYLNYSDGKNIFVNAPDHYYLSEGDILAKSSYPLTKRLILNAYAGFAIVNENTYNVLFENAPPIINSNVTEVMPEIGGGLSFYFWHHLSMETAVYEIFQVGKINSITIFPILGLTVHI